MIMNKYINIIVVVAFSLLFASCNDMLDLDNDGHVTMAGIFTNRNSVRGYLNSCYNYRNGMGIDISSMTDEAYDSRALNSGSNFQHWYTTGLTVDNYGSCSFDGQPWTKFYEGIRRCNVFIANMPTSTAYGTDTEKSGWLAQAYTLRAFYYLELFKRYGSLPLLTKDLGTNYDYSKSKKAKVGEIVKQILSDCDAALSVEDADDGFSWDIHDNQNGIMTRGVAYAIKSEAALFAVSPLFDDGTYTWSDALNVTKDALYQCLSHDYSLWTIISPNAQNAYDTYFLATPYDKRMTDKETIYAVDGELNIWAYSLPTNNGMTVAANCPSQELVDSYETADGQPPVLGYTDTEHLQPIINSASEYDPTNPYANRDPRFYASVYYNGAIRNLNQPNGTKVQTYEGGAEGINATTVTHTQTGYYLRKFNDYRSTKTTNYDGYNRIFRLAELYLNFAEAAYQAGDPDTEVGIGGSMTLSARDAVNIIRERVGMPDLPSGMQKTDFEARYRNERRVEFAFEGKRFFDVRRWKILDSFKVISGMDIKVNGTSISYNRFNFSDRVTTDDKYLLYPLERSEATKMYNLTGVNWQNPGWE